MIVGTSANISRPLGRKFSYELKFTRLSVRVSRDTVMTGDAGRASRFRNDHPRHSAKAASFIFHKARKIRAGRNSNSSLTCPAELAPFKLFIILPLRFIQPPKLPGYSCKRALSRKLPITGPFGYMAVIPAAADNVL